MVGLAWTRTAGRLRRRVGRTTTAVPPWIRTARETRSLLLECPPGHPAFFVSTDSLPCPFEVRSSSLCREHDGGLMGEWHVPVEWLERFLRLEASEDEVRQVARHLATGCLECTDLAYRITAEDWERIYEEVLARAPSDE